MADSAVVVTQGTGTNIDTRTEGTNGNHRAVVVLGDPTTNAGVAPVDATAGLKVDLGADNDVTITGTVDLGATDNAVLDAIAADTGTIAGDTTSIDGKLPALGQALAAASVPVVLPAAQITTLTPPAAITGFATSAKQDTIIGHVDGVETILGTIDADTSTLAGAVAGTEMQVDVVSSALPTGASTAAKQPALGTAGTASTDVLTVQGIASMTALKVDGSGVTQPVSGSLTVDLGANNDVTVTGTVDLGATDNAVLDAIAAAAAAIETAVEGTLTVTGGGGGTEYTEDVATANPIIGTATLIERDDALSSVTPIEGDWIGLRGTAEGALWTQDFNSDGILADTTAIKTSLETAGGQLVNLGANNDVTVTGTVDLGATDNAVLDTIDAVLDTINAKLVTGTDIGDVTINNSTGAAAVNIQDGGNTITVDGTVAVTNADITSIKTAVEILDNAISGSEMQVDVVAALPAGTNAIGKLAANSGVDIGDVDVTSLPALAAGTNAVGKLLPPDVDVTAHTNYARKYYTSAGAATDGIIWSPAAGKRWHVAWIYIQVSAAATVTLEDDKAGGDDPIFKSEFAANSGTFLTFPDQYPMSSGEDAADLTITTTAGNVYVSCGGWEI